GVCPRGLGVGFAFDLKRILCGGRTDRGDVAFLLAVDVRRLATPLGTESGSDLMPLARHALDDFLRHRRIVFAAFKTFIEQFDSKVGDLLAGSLSDLFLNFAAPELDFGNCGGQHSASFLQLLVAYRFAPFGYTNDFDQ